MNSPETIANLPLVDPVQAGELFSADSDPFVTEMQREIWGKIQSELPVDLEKLAVVGPGELGGQLHRIRGYCSSSALVRLAAILHHWEKDLPPGEFSPDLYRWALDTYKSSIQAVEAGFPHLASPGG